MFPCVLCLFWAMTGPDTALISIRLLLERPKFLAAQSMSPAYFRGPSLMKMFQEAEIKALGSTNSSWGIHKPWKKKKSVSARMHTHTHRQTHTHPGPPTSFCYKKSKNREWPREPKVLTLNQIPLDLNWQARPGFRLRYHILEQACMYLRIPSI